MIVFLTKDVVFDTRSFFLILFIHYSCSLTVIFPELSLSQPLEMPLTIWTRTCLSSRMPNSRRASCQFMQTNILCPMLIWPKDPLMELSYLSLRQYHGVNMTIRFSCFPLYGTWGLFHHIGLSFLAWAFIFSCTSNFDITISRSSLSAAWLIWF